LKKHDRIDLAHIRSALLEASPMLLNGYSRVLFDDSAL
jgi:hypothetical protein